MYQFYTFIVLPLLTAGLCYFVRNIRLQYLFSLAVAALHLAVSICLFTGLYVEPLPSLFGADALGKLFLLILSNVYFWVVLVSYAYLKRPVSPRAEDGKKIYFSLLNFYLAANTAAMLSSHLGMYWVCAEATTLSVAPLVYYYRSDESLEAMWKYLFLVSVGIAFAFIGILLLTLSAQGGALEGKDLFFTTLAGGAASLNPIWLKAAFIFIFVGLSTKIGIAPMHYGDIDATSNAPSPVAALMSGSLRLTALLGVLRIYQIIVHTTCAQFASRLLIMGAMLSLFVAFIFMFKVNNYKRMIAYSSVEHLGLITLGIGTGGLAFVGAMYHALYNSIIKVVLFLMAGNIHSRYRSREIGSVRAVLTLMPLSGWIFLAGFLAISGIPPFGIFFSELRIFEGILFSDKPWLLAFVMFFLLFIFINMSRNIFSMLYTAGGSPDESDSGEKFEITHFAAAVLLLIACIISIASPAILYDTIEQIANDFGIYP